MMGCKEQEDKTEQADQSIRARDRLFKKYMNGTCKNLGTHHKVINSQIMDTEGGEDFQAKNEAISQKKITMGEKISSNLGREKPTQIQEGHGTPNRQDWRRGFLCQITLKECTEQGKYTESFQGEGPGQQERQDRQNNC